MFAFDLYVPLKTKSGLAEIDMFCKVLELRVNSKSLIKKIQISLPSII